jgi:hypothetical protein
MLMVAASTLVLQGVRPAPAAATDNKPSDQNTATDASDHEHGNAVSGTPIEGTVGGSTENKDHTGVKYAPKRSTDGIIRLPNGEAADDAGPDGGRFAPQVKSPPAAPTKMPPVAGPASN